MSQLWIIVSAILCFSHVCSVVSQTIHQVPLVPCSALNISSCIFKSDLLEAKLTDKNYFVMYFVDLSGYTFSGLDPFNIEIQALEQTENPNQNKSAAISIYTRSDAFPSPEDYSKKIPNFM